MSSTHPNHFEKTQFSVVLDWPKPAGWGRLLPFVGYVRVLMAIARGTPVRTGMTHWDLCQVWWWPWEVTTRACVDAEQAASWPGKGEHERPAQSNIRSNQSAAHLRAAFSLPNILLSSPRDISCCVLMEYKSCSHGTVCAFCDCQRLHGYSCSTLSNTNDITSIQRRITPCEELVECGTFDQAHRVSLSYLFMLKPFHASREELIDCGTFDQVPHHVSWSICWNHFGCGGKTVIAPPGKLLTSYKACKDEFRQNIRSHSKLDCILIFTIKVDGSCRFFLYYFRVRPWNIARTLYEPFLVCCQLVCYFFFSSFIRPKSSVSGCPHTYERLPETKSKITKQTWSEALSTAP